MSRSFEGVEPPCVHFWSFLFLSFGSITGPGVHDLETCGHLHLFFLPMHANRIWYIRFYGTDEGLQYNDEWNRRSRQQEKGKSGIIDKSRQRAACL